MASPFRGSSLCQTHHRDEALLNTSALLSPFVHPVPQTPCRIVILQAYRHRTIYGSLCPRRLSLISLESSSLFSSPFFFISSSSLHLCISSLPVSFCSDDGTISIFQLYPLDLTRGCICVAYLLCAHFLINFSLLYSIGKIHILPTVLHFHSYQHMLRFEGFLLMGFFGSFVPYCTHQNGRPSSSVFYFLCHMFLLFGSNHFFFVSATRGFLLFISLKH